MGSLLGNVFGSKFQAQGAPLETQLGIPGALVGQRAEEHQLADQLAQQAAGGGPNPVAAQLQQATNRNNQQAAGLISSQKGVNPLLAAKMAAEQGAMNNQQAAGQASQLQANQQVAAQQQLAGLNLGQQQVLQGGLNSQNQNSLQNANMVNTINSGTANNNANVGNNMVSGAAGAAALFLAGGGVVPGKAQVPGDSVSNDNVSAKLSPGEIVIPRSHSQDPAKAKAFIDHIMDRKKKSEPKGYSKVLKKHKELEKRIKALESDSE